MITFVWAEDQKGQIGLNGHLPWQLPGDMKHFKEITIGHPIIMGRKTFASLPRLLPQRLHVVLTKDEQLISKYAENKQVVTVNSLTALNDWVTAHEQEQISVIGGNSVFATLKERVDVLERTVIDATFAGDTVMTALDYQQFNLIKTVKHTPNEQDKYPYTFLTYLRKEVQK
ncbi:dihydrofolate reductase [Lactobacillus sp. ESL0679]|uniref:dihydrofolate reductase n=1 Tax=Lactobacillus sp. ESL0679 TaxID=2983209 RepID=UPI0023F80396|nr:dihydrofolate reductase [Lactobacillus sp. ESL0679]MDF7682778.1 dihydrofolate reductase [Lactobacillus sp. ESL0679]